MAGGMYPRQVFVTSRVLTLWSGWIELRQTITCMLLNVQRWWYTGNIIPKERVMLHSIVFVCVWLSICANSSPR